MQCLCGQGRPNLVRCWPAGCALLRHSATGTHRAGRTHCIYTSITLTLGKFGSTTGAGRCSDVVAWVLAAALRRSWRRSSPEEGRRIRPSSEEWKSGTKIKCRSKRRQAPALRGVNVGHSARVMSMPDPVRAVLPLSNGCRTRQASSNADPHAFTTFLTFLIVTLFLCIFFLLRPCQPCTALHRLCGPSRFLCV
jgi:hypothetical protein